MLLWFKFFPSHYTLCFLFLNIRPLLFVTWEAFLLSSSSYSDPPISLFTTTCLDIGLIFLRFSAEEHDPAKGNSSPKALLINQIIWWNFKFGWFNISILWVRRRDRPFCDKFLNEFWQYINAEAFQDYEDHVDHAWLVGKIEERVGVEKVVVLQMQLLSVNLVCFQIRKSWSNCYCTVLALIDLV